MAITQLEGNEIAAQFMTAFSEGFAQNNHSETMKDLLADELMWSWPKGTAVSTIRNDFAELGAFILDFTIIIIFIPHTAKLLTP